MRTREIVVSVATKMFGRGGIRGGGRESGRERGRGGERDDGGEKEGSN